MSSLGDIASAITGALGGVGNFFTGASTELTDFVKFLDTDVVDFFVDVEDDVRDVISFVSTAISDVATFMQNIASEFISALQTVANAIYSAGTTFLSFMEGLAKDAVNVLSTIPQDIINFTLGVAQGFANTFSQALSSAFSLIFNAFGGKFQYISPFISTLPSLLITYFGPAMIGKYAEVLIDKISDFLPKISVDLSPLGIGGEFDVDLPKIIKGIIDPLKDFLGDVMNEITDTFKEYIKEPFVSDFKIHIRELFDEIGLGDIPFVDPQFSQISGWVSARSFDELKPHFKETLMLTGFPEWFTNAYLQEPVNDYIPQNPLFRPVGIKDVIQGVEYGFMSSDAISKYAYNNLITPKTAQLMYQNQTARLVQRAIEQGIRQFIVKPEDAVSLLQSYATLSGTNLLNKYYNLEYQYAEKRLVRQVLRSLLSRALANYGRPYEDPSILNKTVSSLFKELEYPAIVKEAFEDLIKQSQQIQLAELIYRALIDGVREGFYSAHAVDSIIKQYQMNATAINELISIQLTQILQKEQLTELQAKARNFMIKSDDIAKELKAIGYADQLINAFVFQYHTIPLTQFQMKYVEQFAREGYYNTHMIRNVFQSIGLTKDFADTFESYATQAIQYKSLLQEVQFKLKNFLLSDKDAERLLKSQHFNDALISSLIVQYYVEPFVQLQLRYTETLAKTQLLDEKTLQQLLVSAGIVKDIAEIYAKMFASEYYTSALISYYKTLASHGILKDDKQIPASIYNLEIKPAYDLYTLSATINYYKSLASHGILMTSKDIPANVFDLEIKPAFDEYVLSTTLRYIEESLKTLSIDSKTALAELKKLKIPDSIASMLVNISIPTLYSVRSIAQNLVEGEIYHVQRVPINLSSVTGDLKKLNIPDNQIQILADEIATEVALELWKKYLPTLSDVENAVKTGYPYLKLAEMALIPSQLLNLKLDLLQHQQVAELVQSLHTYYVELLTYGVTQTQLEMMLKQYGYNDAMLSVLKTEAQIRRELTTYEELGITPSKAISMSEYVENPDDFLRSIFTSYHVPADLQQKYLTYARNRRLQRYISDVIETIAELAEYGKITTSQAQQYLNQFKKYGLTDEEIQLILLNLQLRSQLQSSYSR